MRERTRQPRKPILPVPLELHARSMAIAKARRLRDGDLVQWTQVAREAMALGFDQLEAAGEVGPLTPKP